MSKKVLCACLSLLVAFSLIVSPYSLSSGSGVPVKKQTADASMVAPFLEIFGTILCASGIFVSGSNQSEYNANLSTLGSDFQNWCNNSGIPWENVVISLGGCLNTLNIVNLSVANQLLPILKQWWAESGSELSVEGTSSNTIVNTSTVYAVGGYEFNVTASPVEVSYSIPDGYRWIGTYQFSSIPNKSYFMVAPISSSVGSIINNSGSIALDVSGLKLLSGNNSLMTFNPNFNGQNTKLWLAPFISWALYEGATYIGNTSSGAAADSDKPAVASPDNLLKDNTQDLPAENVDLLNPTDEDLEAGYNQDILNKLDDIEGVISNDGVLDFLQAAWLACGGVLMNLGSTIESAASSAAGAVTGVLEGAIEGVGAAVDAATAAISGAIAGVGASVLAISDAITHFFDLSNIDYGRFRFPRIPQIFPFCLPWDLVSILTLVSAEPVAPSFSFDLPNVDGSYQTEVLDLAFFDAAAFAVRIMELIAAAAGLIFVTKKMLEN